MIDLYLTLSNYFFFFVVVVLHAINLQLLSIPNFFTLIYLLNYFGGFSGTRLLIPNHMGGSASAEIIPPSVI